MTFPKWSRNLRLNFLRRIFMALSNYVMKRPLINSLVEGTALLPRKQQNGTLMSHNICGHQWFAVSARGCGLCYPGLRRCIETDNIRWITIHREVKTILKFPIFFSHKVEEDIFLRFLLIREPSTKSHEKFNQYINSVHPKFLLVNQIPIS